MAWAEVILSEKLLLVFCCFTNKMVLFGFAKSKAMNFSFKDYFDRSICNFQRFARQKTIQIRSSSKFKSEVFFAACGHSVQLKEIASRKHHCQSKVRSMYWQKYKPQIVGLCSFNSF